MQTNTIRRAAPPGGGSVNPRKKKKKVRSIFDSTEKTNACQRHGNSLAMQSPHGSTEKIKYHAARIDLATKDAPTAAADTQKHTHTKKKKKKKKKKKNTKFRATLTSEAQPRPASEPTPARSVRRKQRPAILHGTRPAAHATQTRHTNQREISGGTRKKNLFKNFEKKSSKTRHKKIKAAFLKFEEKQTLMAPPARVPWG